MALLLLLLLAVSSVSLQELQDQNGLEDTLPADRSTRPLPPAKLRQKRQTQCDNGHLKWVQWTGGSIPNGAVSIYSEYSDRTDYVCKYSCNAGFYNPSIGQFCHYPYGDREYTVSTFEILVNENNFESLKWKDDSYGSVPQHSVRTCCSDELYVGKNKYGLGKVHPRHEAFFLPWKGKEYWYKYYQVLTFKQDIENEHVSDIKYDTENATIFHYPPEVMTSTTIINHECKQVMKTASLSKTIRMDRRWDVSASLTVSVRKTFTAGIPTVASGKVEVSAEVSVQASGGHTYSEEVGQTLSVDVTVPPNHSCKARMLGHKYKIDIPFTARLTRTYSDGRTSWTSVSGTYNGVQVGEVHTVVERCVPIPNATPCP